MLKKKVSKGRPTKSPQKSPKNIPAMAIAANTEAMPITPENSPILPIESQKEPQFSQNIPSYRLGCPRCPTKILVTEQKYHGKRLCRCRECGWRGEMI